MITLTRAQFHEALLKARERSSELAEAELASSLPKEFVNVLDAFGQGRRASTEEEIANTLYKDGYFPRVVVVGIRGIVDGKTLVVFAPSGHKYVNDLSLTWDERSGLGPFNPVGLMVRGFVAKRPRPLTLKDLEESAEFWHQMRSE